MNKIIKKICTIGLYTVLLTGTGMQLTSCNSDSTTSDKTSDTTDDKESQGLAFYLQDDGTYAVSGIGTCTDTDIVIPSIYEGKSVTSIGSYAFIGCTNLTSITIPDSVTSVGIGAFSECSRLLYNEYDNGYYLGNETNPYLVLEKAKSKLITSCEINENCKFIDSGAFADCTNLTSITIPDGITSIGWATFYNCTSLANITIPDCVTTIGDSAFFNCKSLRSIILPNSLTIIEDNAFLVCSELTTITIPNSVTSIGDNAFSGCSSLTSVTLGNSVTTIGKEAFEGCNLGPTITIPKSVTTIEVGAFGEGIFLTTVYYKGTPTEWENISIVSSGNDKLISATKYYYSETQPTDTTYKYWHYVDGEPTPWEI